MNVYQVFYFTDGYQHISIVAAKDEKKAILLVSNKFALDDNFQLDTITQLDISKEDVIHTETYEN